MSSNRLNNWSSLFLSYFYRAAAYALICQYYVATAVAAAATVLFALAAAAVTHSHAISSRSHKEKIEPALFFKTEFD